MAAAALLLTGCGTPGAYDTWYRVAVDGGVVGNNPSQASWPRLSLPPFAPSRASSKFSDENHSAEWTLWDWNIKLAINNKTDQPLSILWPEARIAWLSREESLQNVDERLPKTTVLPPGKSMTFHAFPRPLLHWMPLDNSPDGRGYYYSVAQPSPIFGRRYPANQKKAERQALAREAAGQQVLILLPMQIRGQQINYAYRLKILDANSYRPWH